MRVSRAASAEEARRDSPAPGLAKRRARRCALVVRSVLVPQESCVLLNPEHGDIDKIMVAFPEPFSFLPSGVRRRPGGSVA